MLNLTCKTPHTTDEGSRKHANDRSSHRLLIIIQYISGFTRNVKKINLVLNYTTHNMAIMILRVFEAG